MKGQLEAILVRHGQRVTLKKRETDESLEVRAFLQPILKKQEQPPVAVTPLGAVNEQRWLYLGSSQVAIAPGDRVQQGETRLAVQEARGVFLGTELLYHWALLQPEKEAAV